METDVAYFVTYPCPGCKAQLEASHSGWRGWLRCPTCGTPALPPEVFRGHPATRRRLLETPGEDILIIEDDRVTARQPLPDPASLIPPPTSPVITSLRLFFGIGLVVSLFLLLISYLDDNSQVLGIAGSTAVIFFLLLIRVSGRRRVQNAGAGSRRDLPLKDQ